MKYFHYTKGSQLDFLQEGREEEEMRLYPLSMSLDSIFIEHLFIGKELETWASSYAYIKIGKVQECRLGRI